MSKARFDGTMASCHSDVRDAINRSVRAGGHAWFTTDAGQRLRIQCIKRQGDQILVQRPRLNTWEPLPPNSLLEWPAARQQQFSGR